MIKRNFIALSICIAILVMDCGNKTSSQSSPYASIGSDKKKGPGRIQFTKEIHNFGTLKEGEIVAYSFQFKNSGSSPFHLKKVEPTCGCLNVQFSNDEVDPGYVSNIEVVFHT